MDLRRHLIAACLAACALAPASACTRMSTAESSPSGGAGSTVSDDMKGVAKATEKAAKDLGQATSELADKAGKRLGEVTNEAGVNGDDAWITTKVKSELTTQGVDPLHVHVDTAGKVVTLSGTVGTADEARKAVSLAKAVKGVTGVQNHLFVKPGER